MNQRHSCHRMSDGCLSLEVMALLQTRIYGELLTRGLPFSCSIAMMF